MRIFVVPLVEHKRFSVGISTVLRHRDHGKASETAQGKEQGTAQGKPFNVEPALLLSNFEAFP